MAAPYYVEPEYWIEGYAIGDAKLSGAEIAASTAVTAAGQQILLSGAGLAAVTATVADGHRIALGRVDAGSAFTVTAVGSKVSLGAAQVGVAASASATALAVYLAGAHATVTTTAFAVGNRVQRSSAALAVNVAIVANGREKWQVDPTTSELWDTIKVPGFVPSYYVTPDYWDEGYAVGSDWLPKATQTEIWDRVA